MIRVESVVKQYSGVTAVDGVSFEVEAGTVFGLLGPNGAGKSTLLNVILGYTTPTSGSVTVFGRDAITDSVAVREQTGVLPEATAVYDRLTGREHLQMAADVKGVEVNTSELLSTVGLTETEADKRAAGYSKGMRQRLLLGTALVGDPELLVLDEPSSGLDPNGARELREIVDRLAADGTTVLFSTHRLAEAESVCDRVGVLDDGELVTTTDVTSLTANQQTTVGFEVGSLPPSIIEEIENFEDVESVMVGRETQQLEVLVTENAAKVPVFRLIDEKATVQDFWVERSSVGDLFEAAVGDTRTDAGGSTVLQSPTAPNTGGEP